MMSKFKENDVVRITKGVLKDECGSVVNLKTLTPNCVHVLIYNILQTGFDIPPCDLELLFRKKTPPKKLAEPTKHITTADVENVSIKDMTPYDDMEIAYNVFLKETAISVIIDLHPPMRIFVKQWDDSLSYFTNLELLEAAVASIKNKLDNRKEGENA
jgi:hypothetical protein